MQKSRQYLIIRQKNSNNIFRFYKQFFQMLSSSGSHFEKDLASTMGFEVDNQFVQSFDFVQAMDQFDLEQSCLIRLKSQREKIQELTKLYQQNEKELVKHTDKQKELQEQVQRLSDMAGYKQDWCELKKQFDDLSKRFKLTDRECSELKQEMKGLLGATQQKMEELGQEIKIRRDEKALLNAHWESVMADKDEQLVRQSRTAQERQYQLCQKIQKLQQQIDSLKESLCQKVEELQVKKQAFYCQLKAKEEDIVNFQRVVESFKRQNTQYKRKMLEMQQTSNKQKDQFCQMIEQLKNQLRMFKKDQSDKENQLYEYKEMIKKCDTKNQTLQSTLSEFKTNMKKFKVHTDTNFKKINNVSEEQKMKLQLFVEQLKGALQKQMQEKEQLCVQLRRVRGVMQRKQQQQKQRKLLLMSEFREIDKMQKLVKKII